jgi:ABC-type dipeptide/oligopeptide/nickel transport system permease subunit
MDNIRHMRSRVLAIGVSGLFLLVTVVKAGLIWNCIVSFLGSLLWTAMHPAEYAMLLNGTAAEYWLAGLAWCLAPVFIVRTWIVPAASFSSMLPRAARITLSGFIFISLTAPIIAPLPPLAQGESLKHVRSLPPLTLGSLCESIPPPSLSESSGGFLEREVGAANRFLLYRTVTFTRTTDGTDTLRDHHAAALGSQSTIMFLFGTDGVGRDILSRVLYGTRYSLGIGFIVVFISLTFGSAIGMISGYAGGFIDNCIMRIVDVLLSIPALFLALTLMATIGQSQTAMIIVLSVTGWMGTARILRGEVISLRRREFISASRLLGTPPVEILRRHILPNILPTIKNAGILQLGNIILAEASMSFLGLGIQSPQPSWGNMIADSLSYSGSTPYTAIFPGIALSILIISVHLVGEHS